MKHMADIHYRCSCPFIGNPDHLCRRACVCAGIESPTAMEIHTRDCSDAVRDMHILNGANWNCLCPCHESYSPAPGEKHRYYKEVTTRIWVEKVPADEGLLPPPEAS